MCCVVVSQPALGPKLCLKTNSTYWFLILHRLKYLYVFSITWDDQAAVTAIPERISTWKRYQPSIIVPYPQTKWTSGFHPGENKYPPGKNPEENFTSGEIHGHINHPGHFKLLQRYSLDCTPVKNSSSQWKVLEIHPRWKSPQGHLVGVLP